MKSNYGHNLSYTIFGESHSKGIGISIDGLLAGFEIDFEKVNQSLLQRQGNAEFNTARQEKVEYEILSGYLNNKTTGSTLHVVFYNNNTKSKDYSHLINQPRPGHADYVAKQKWNNSNDYRGGGHFSGRITTPIVFLGAIIKQILEQSFENFNIISHISKFQGVCDDDYYMLRRNIVEQIMDKYEIDVSMEKMMTLKPSEQVEVARKIKAEMHNYLNNNIEDINFPTLKSYTKTQMLNQANDVKTNLDSAGGLIETIVINPPSFIGEPFFTSIESIVSSLLFSIPSVKSVGFGFDSGFIDAKGSEVSDEIIYFNEKMMYTLFNYNGGINGGITNSEDIVIKTGIKPIASIAKKQYTYSESDESITPLVIGGRHDATIINRVIPIIDSMILVAIYDMVLEQKKYE